MVLWHNTYIDGASWFEPLPEESTSPEYWRPRCQSLVSRRFFFEAATEWLKHITISCADERVLLDLCTRRPPLLCRTMTRLTVRHGVSEHCDSQYTLENLGACKNVQSLRITVGSRLFSTLADGKAWREDIAEDDLWLMPEMWYIYDMPSIRLVELVPGKVGCGKSPAEDEQWRKNVSAMEKCLKRAIEKWWNDYGHLANSGEENDMHEWFQLIEHDTVWDGSVDWSGWDVKQDTDLRSAPASSSRSSVAHGWDSGTDWHQIGECGKPDQDDQDAQEVQNIVVDLAAHNKKQKKREKRQRQKQRKKAAAAVKPQNFPAQQRSSNLSQETASLHPKQGRQQRIRSLSSLGGTMGYRQRLAPGTVILVTIAAGALAISLEMGRSSGQPARLNAALARQICIWYWGWIL